MSASGFPSDMGQVYIGLLDHSQNTIKRVFEAMADTAGCILFHCTAGKDRTGVTAMLLLDLVGAEEDGNQGSGRRFGIAEIQHDPHIGPFAENVWIG